MTRPLADFLANLLSLLWTGAALLGLLELAYRLSRWIRRQLWARGVVVPPAEAERLRRESWCVVCGLHVDDGHTPRCTRGGQ